MEHNYTDIPEYDELIAKVLSFPLSDIKMIRDILTEEIEKREIRRVI